MTNKDMPTITVWFFLYKGGYVYFNNNYLKVNKPTTKYIAFYNKYIILSPV